MDQDHSWEKFLLDKSLIMRYPDWVYHRIELIGVDVTTYRILKFAHGYISHEPVINPGKCEACDHGAIFTVTRKCTIRDNRDKIPLCNNCLNLVTNIKRTIVGGVACAYNDNYMIANFIEYRRVPLKEIKNGLQLLPQGWSNARTCSLCGFVPKTDCICNHCHTHVVRYMVLRVIMLRGKLIDDVLVAVVRAVIE